MTNEELTDHFAGIVLQGMIANSCNDCVDFYQGRSDGKDEVDMIVSLAYDIAIRMIQHKADLIEDGTL